MIEVDLQGLLPPSFLALLDDSFVTAVLDDVASSARARWIRLAQQRLTSSKRAYIDGIQPIEGRGLERNIALVGWLPNAVENGLDSYDLRATLLKEDQSGVRKSKAGKKYRAVPFRHGTPGSQGQAGMPMGMRYGPQGAQSLAHAAEGLMDKGSAAALGKAVYGQAKRLQRQESLGDTVRGRRRTYFYDRRRDVNVAVPKLAPHHSTDIFAGMRRTGAGRHTQYMTFRTISEANPEGWIHPGMMARNLHKEVEAHVQKLVVRAVHAAVNAAFKGVP
jgi:hypothetical protein